MGRKKLALTAAACAVALTLLPAGCGQEVAEPAPSATRMEGQVTAFTNVSLVPMTEEVVVEDQTVLVEGSRITQIGPSGQVEIPGNAVVIDGAGAYLMPGLADMHMHTKDDWDDWPVSPLSLYLANGVTTLRCMGPHQGVGLDSRMAIGQVASPEYVLRMRDDINAGKLSGPTIYTAGRAFVGPVDDPQGNVREQSSLGYDFIKPYSFLSKEEFHEVMTAAKDLDMYVAGHIPFAVGLDGILSEGMDEIAHVGELRWELIDFDRNKGDDIRQQFAPGLPLGTRVGLLEQQWWLYLFDTWDQQATAFDYDFEAFAEQERETISDTMARLQSASIPICTGADAGGARTQAQQVLDPEAYRARPENKYLPQWYMDAFRQGKTGVQVGVKGREGLLRFYIAMVTRLLVELKQAGILLVLGTDAGTGKLGFVPGFSVHDELRGLTENGLTPYEAIATGTVNASRVVEAMTGENDFGTIEVGKRADLILVNGNPLEDVANIKELRGVMAAGKWYSKEELEDMIAIED